MNKKNNNSSILRIIKLLRPYSGWIVLSLLSALGYVYFTLLIPILLGDAVDCIVGVGNVDT